MVKGFLISICLNLCSYSMFNIGCAKLFLCGNIQLQIWIYKALWCALIGSLKSIGFISYTYLFHNCKPPCIISWMINRFKSKRNFLVIMFGESLKVPKLNKITSLKKFKIRNNCDDDTLPLINNLKLADSSRQVCAFTNIGPSSISTV